MRRDAGRAEAAETFGLVDVPHDWLSWRAQLAHHLPRFV